MVTGIPRVQKIVIATRKWVKISYTRCAIGGSSRDNISSSLFLILISDIDVNFKNFNQTILRQHKGQCKNKTRRHSLAKKRS